MPAAAAARQDSGVRIDAAGEGKAAPWHRLRRPLGMALVICAVLLVLAANYLSDDLRCEVEPDTSTYGEAEWSWLPLGTGCHWTEERNGFDRVEDPGWGPTLVVGGMMVTGLLLLWTPKVRRPGNSHRQSAAVAASGHAQDDQAFIDAISLDDD